MADAITAALLKEADAFGVRAEMRIPPQVQAQRDAEAAVIKARESQPNGGGAIPTSAVVQGSTAGQSDPITASLMAEAGGAQQQNAPVTQSRVDQIPGMTPQPTATQAEESPSLFGKVVSAVKPYVENAYGFVGDIAKNALSKDLAAKEAALSVGTSLVAPIVGNLAGAATTLASDKRGTQAGIQAGEKRAAEITNALTYQPRAPEAREALATGAKALEASKLQGMGPPEFTALSDVAAGLKARSTVNGLMKEAGPTTSKAEPGRMASVGASGVAGTEQARALAANASPEVRDAVERALKIKNGRVNIDALKRHVEADSLPVKVDLTEGQATQDVALLSNEQNSRGMKNALAERFQKQNEQLVENTAAIREQVAPDVFVRGKPEQGQILIDAYHAKDSALNADITAKYAALKDANGGQLPIDAKAFVDTADKALHKQLLYDSVPGTGGGMHGGNAGLRATLDRLRDNGMTFENFEALRTNLARTMRSATDGNARAAAGVIRDALESLPMPVGAEHLKPLADAARSAAKARFDLLKKDPAYKAVVEGKASADAFIDKYIIGKGAQLKNVQTMKENIAHDPVAQQVMASGTVDYLTQAANIIDGRGNFSQAGYNKALEGVRSKLKAILGPEQARQLETLGNVARYTQAQPRGSFVNNSNTAVTLMKEAGKTSLEGMANVAAKGLPIGTWGRKIVSGIAQRREINKSLQPGAGILLRDIKEAGK